MSPETSLDSLSRIQRLADSGRNAAVVAELGVMPTEVLRQSPTLSLLFGIAYGRLGHHRSGKEWVTVALGVARSHGDSAIEARSLNVCGAIAFQEGFIDEAMRFFNEGMAEAESLGDRATVGRCSNNLGIIANLRGQYAQAIGFQMIALAAFQQVGHRNGVGETLHNLAISYRDQRAYAKALESEERAGAEVTAAGDLGLLGLIHCGRGEIRLRMGDVELGQAQIQRALDLHREVGDRAGELEDLRALAEVLYLLGQPGQAQAMLRDVVVRAKQIARPLLVAQAERDLARLLHREKKGPEAIAVAHEARKRFVALGAVCEVGRIDGLLREIDS